MEFGGVSNFISVLPFPTLIHPWPRHPCMKKDKSENEVFKVQLLTRPLRVSCSPNTAQRAAESVSVQLKEAWLCSAGWRGVTWTRKMWLSWAWANDRDQQNVHHSGNQCEVTAKSHRKPAKFTHPLGPLQLGYKLSEEFIGRRVNNRNGWDYPELTEIIFTAQQNGVGEAQNRN